MMMVLDALNLILGDMKSLKAASTPVGAALGRVLAEDVIASLDLPPFPNSGVDGFAVHSVDLKSAGPVTPVRLGLMGESRAGDHPSSLPPGRNCLRIMTGAPLPLGADAVVM
ncbi:MAG: molybdopterin molybdenumtransferase MoeA, partial [Armatimonadota bacterium]|nr:molybdopterin molybdenumtransferase MoeA [Armatimonadota bacterium]